jgi:hypothetical protein
MVNNTADRQRNAQESGYLHADDGDPMKPFAHHAIK